MTKKDQAVAAIKATGLKEALRSTESSIGAARAGLLAFDGEERQAVREAYAELVLSECRGLIAELQSFVATIEQS